MMPPAGRSGPRALFFAGAAMSRLTLALAALPLVLVLKTDVSGQTPPIGAHTKPERDRAVIQNRLGWEQMRVEHWPGAADAFRRAIDIDATYEYAYYGLGRAQMALKRYVEAIATLEKCAGLYRAQAGRQFSTAQEAQRYRQDR